MTDRAKQLDGVTENDRGNVLIPRVEDMDGDWVRFSDDFEKEVSIYREACRQNIENDRIQAMDNRVVARLMPKNECKGGVIVHRTKYPEDGAILARYGTVIAVGDYMKGQLEPGDEICFSQMFGKKFAGTYNPLKLDPSTIEESDEAAIDTYGWADWSDEIRIFQMDPDHYEILGVVEYDLVGTTVHFNAPGRPSEEPVPATVLEESALLGGIAKLETEDGETFWAPHRYIDT